MRQFTAAVLLLCAAVSRSQTNSGTYQPAAGSASAWSVNDHHTLIWDGVPYLPEGIRIGGTTEEIASAQKAGFKDLIVDVPPTGAGWKETFQALETKGTRYILSIDSLIPSAKGFSIEPEAYRISGITADRHVEFPLPAATSAIVLLVTERDATIQSSQRVPIANGKFSFDVKAPNELEHVLLVYPEQSDAEHPDYWDGFDTQRDILLTALQSNKPGKGLRGILNPMGKLFNPVSSVGRFVPESAYFRMELRAYLESKYRNLETAERAWAMSANDIDSFEWLSRMVPLWSGGRGVGELWDPVTDRMYPCESKRSLAWLDIDTVTNSAAAKRFERLVPAIQLVADVPVLQEWTGWIEPFESASPELNGIGFRASGSAPSDVASSSARAVSSVTRWKKPGWLVGTDLDLSKCSDVGGALDQLASMGARGWFVRPGPKVSLSQIVADGDRRSGDVSPASTSPQAIFFPENAMNPAAPQILPAGQWWLPSPADGNRVDFGGGFHAYRYSDGTNLYTAIWTSGTTSRVRLRLLNPKGLTFTTVDGTNPKPAIKKNGIDVMLGPSPTIVSGTDELPVPEAVYLDTGDKYAQLLRYGQALRKDIAEDGFFYQEALSSFERDPGASFLSLRKQFWVLNKKLGKFTWIEAEQTKDTNFSEVTKASGCSGGSVLALHTPLSLDSRGFYAEYPVQVKTQEEQEVWIAARIPEDARKFVSISVGGQTLAISGDPQGTYSSGYGWYYLGTTKLNGITSKLTLQVNSPGGADLAVDTLLLFPGHFKPNGLTMPDAIPFTAPLGRQPRPID